VGDTRRSDLGHRHDRQLRGFLRADDWTRQFFLPGRGQHNDLHHMGHFCVERIPRRRDPSQGSARDCVSLLSIGTELYSARLGDPLGKRTLAELEHRRQDDEGRQ
jgi:hypothetical protein